MCQAGSWPRRGACQAYDGTRLRFGRRVFQAHLGRDGHSTRPRKRPCKRRWRARKRQMSKPAVKFPAHAERAYRLKGRTDMLFLGGFTFSNFLADVLSVFLFCAVVLVADHRLRRPIPAAGHIGRRQDSLGDRPDFVPLSTDFYLPNHTRPRDGGAADPASRAGSRRATPFRWLQRG